MNTLVHSRPVRTALLAGGLALVAGCYFSLPALAAGIDPSLPSVTISGVKKGDDKVPASAAAGKGTGTSKGTTGSRGAAANSSVPKGAKLLSATKGELTYIITVHNNSRVAVKNIQVEYHFYNKTTVTDNGILTDKPTVTDITSTENIDLDASKSKDIQTQPIPHENTQIQTAGQSSGNGRTRVTTSSTYGSTITQLIGWHIELSYNGKIIQKTDDPTNLQDLLKKLEPES